MKQPSFPHVPSIGTKMLCLKSIRSIDGTIHKAGKTYEVTFSNTKWFIKYAKRYIAVANIVTTTSQ